MSKGGHFEKHSECPYCFYQSDAHTEAFKDEGSKPRPGDLTLCLRCGKTAVYDSTLDLVAMTDEEWEKIDLQTRADLARAHAAWAIIAKPRMDAQYGKPFPQEPRR